MCPRKRYKSFTSRRKKPTSKKRTLREKARFLWRIVKLLIVLIIIGTVALLYYGRRIDRTIAEQFDQQRRWDLPSRVYSDAEYLYPGTNTAARRIVAKLDRLGYRNTGEEIRGPGDYALGEGRLDIYLHDFDYPDERFAGFPVRLLLSGKTIASIVNLDDREGLDLIRLEPELITSIFNDLMEDRTIVTLAEVPPTLVEAIVLIEDERFFKHGGVDPIGILRAALVNLRSMRIVQGGSTLTQQLVKNFFLHAKKTYARKLNEAIMAWRIERTHSKSEILQAYLNEIYLGQRGASSVSGVAEASRLYFGKNVDQLTLGECALLAGMIRSPSKYNPMRHPEAARERRDFVLQRMRENGLVSNEDYQRARAERIVTPKLRIRVGAAPYFTDFVKRQLAEFYSPETLTTEGLRIFTTLDTTMQVAAEAAVSEELKLLEKDFAHLLPKDHADPLQACLITIQPNNGYVRALVGGRDYGSSQFDRCTQAARQPGSTFKPFVYLTAFDARRTDKLFTPASIIDDSSFDVESGGKNWKPRNYDKKDHGPVTLRRALEKSYNIATAKLALEAGLENVVATARDAGITSELMAVPSLSLGAFEVSPMEMASAYTIFPNGGILAQPIAIINVVTKENDVLEKKQIRMKRAFDAAPVAVTTKLLEGVVDRGTGAGTRARGFTAPAGGKTGTTSNYRDAWFVGFTPNLLALAWVGFDDNAEMKMSGGRAALPIWTHFMKQAAAEESGKFPSPPGVILVKIDPVTGGLVSNSCPGGIFEAFIEGTEPELACEDIDLSAPSFTPPPLSGEATRIAPAAPPAPAQKTDAPDYF